MKRKNEKLCIIEKQYFENKEEYEKVKSKYETLKKIVSQNEMASRVFSLTNPISLTKTTASLNSNKEEPKLDSQTKITFNMPSTKNIVKPIKGGTHGIETTSF